MWRFLVVVSATLMSLQLPGTALAAPGDLDTTFGDAGVVMIPMSPETSASANAVAIQDDGKIVVAGGYPSFALMRLSDDGTPDAAFGTDGRAALPGSYEKAEAVDVLVQADGKIVVLVWALGYGERAYLHPKAIVARFDVDGIADPSFGNQGKVRVGSRKGTWPSAMQLAPDGDLVVAGSIEDADMWELQLARLNTDGTPDLVFGDGGVLVTTVRGRDTFAGGLALGRHGGITVGASIRPNTDRIAVLRFTRGGVPAKRFGDEGVALFTVRLTSGEALVQLATPDVIHDADGGWLVSAFGHPEAVGGGQDFGYGSAILRLDPVGALDPAFDGQGNLGQAGEMVLQPDGMIVVAGGFCCGGGSEITPAVARLDAGGTADASFGGDDGVASLLDALGYLGSLPGIEDLALQPDGKIVAVTRAGWGGGGFALVRLMP